MAEVTRSRMLFAGAGAAIQFPLNHSRSSVSSSSSSAAAAASSTETRNAYLVTPAAHIGRVVTGVVFIAQQTRLLNREFTQGVASQNSSVVEEFGLATISFADKLAEQGYKVFVLNVFPEKAKADSDDVVDEQMRVVEQAVFFLKQKQDIQRVALCGFGPGADLAIKMSIERPALLDCSIMMCPNGNLAWTKPEGAPTPAPMLLLVGDKNPFSQSQAFQQLTDTFAADTNTAVSSPILRSRVFPNQDKGFAFSYITDEDAATQAIAEILDWLVTHLHRFRAAAGTSDGDPWWPQGRNGPFFNVGLKTWQDTRAQWVTQTQARPPPPAPVPSHLLFDGLSSVRRTFELPHRMRLADVIELFVEIWDVQQ
ncbi:hypothetical protein Gpo141_00002058 [Globisporangium polare]